MAARRSPQTQEKRRREREKQVKRQDKMAKRLERNAAKREAGDTEPVPLEEQARDALTAADFALGPAAEVERRP